MKIKLSKIAFWVHPWEGTMKTRSFTNTTLDSHGIKKIIIWLRNEMRSYSSKMCTFKSNKGSNPTCISSTILFQVFVSVYVKRCCLLGIILHYPMDLCTGWSWWSDSGTQWVLWAWGSLPPIDFSHCSTPAQVTMNKASWKPKGLPQTNVLLC